VYQDCHNCRRQPAAEKKESRLAERCVEPGPSNPVSFASTFFAQQLSQHLALFQGSHAAQCLFRSGITFLRYAQLEIELCQCVIGCKAIGLKPGCKFQMINRRVDIAGKRVGKAQKDVGLTETWRNFGAPGERSERRSPAPGSPI